MAYYPFNGNANDESGNGNNGEVNGATLAADRNGEFGKAYSFDGEDDRIVSVGSGWPGGDSDRTVSVWFKPISTANGNLFTFGDGTRNNTRFSLLLNHNEAGTITFVGQENDKKFDVENFVGAWSNIIISLKEDIGTLYINGTKVDDFGKSLNTDGSMPFGVGSQVAGA